MFRISLRQLFFFMAAVALAIVSLKYASVFWQGFIGLLAMLAVFAAVIIGVFERGPRQAFAIGFSIVVLGYALLILAGLRSQLPTSLLLDRLYPAILEPGWMVTDSGERVPEATAGRIRATYTGPSLSPIQPQNYPLPDFYYPIGHYWWTMILGYVGGALARFIYIRRKQVQAAPAE